MWWLDESVSISEATVYPFQFDGEAVDNGTTIVERGATLNITETDGSLTLGAGKLTMVAQSTANMGDLGMITDASFARAAGLAFIHHYENAAINDVTSPIWGGLFLALTDVDGYISSRNTNIQHGFADEHSVVANESLGFINAVPSDAYWSDGEHTLAIILRSSGAFYVANNQLVYVDDANTTTPLYALMSMQFSQCDPLAFVAGVDLSALDWESSLTTNEVSGNVSASDECDHEADFVMQFDVSSKAFASNIHFRKQDSNNYWQIQPGTFLRLHEVVGGSSTQRGSNSYTAGRILLRVAGDIITVYDETGRRYQYTSAANFQTETDCVVATVGDAAHLSNLVTRPFDLPTAAQNALAGVIE